MSYIVYSYEPGTPPKCEAYGVVDMQGPQPGSEPACEALAAEIRVQHPTATVTVVPFGAYQSTANQFVVKATGNDVTLYYGPWPTRSDADAGENALKHGHEDPQIGDSPVTEVLEVTAAELAGLAVEPLPE